MAKKDSRKDLVQIIRDNPGCIATIDNDCWWLSRQPSEDNPHDEDSDEWGEWDEANQIARDGEVKPLGDGGYGSGCSYGGDILQALAQIVGVKVESV